MQLTSASSIRQSPPGYEAQPLASWPPGPRYQCRTKRSAQRDLVCLLEPKEKEHQRKKVLRHFLTWRSKQPTQTDADVKFWAWVKTINPDNTGSEDRFKSMSFEFLDKLLERRIFRDSLESWIDGYENSLGTGDEDMKTRTFLRFIRDSMAIKLYTDRVKTELLSLLTPLDFDSMPPGLFQAVPQHHPDRAGIYAEAKCRKRDCGSYQVKVFSYIGVNGHFAYSQISGLCLCQSCEQSLLITNIGGYGTYDELKLYSWRELRFFVQDFTQEQHEYLRTMMLGDAGAVPEKKIKLGTVACVKSHPICVLLETLLDESSELKEYHDLLLSLEGKNREVRLTVAAVKTIEMQIQTLEEEANTLEKELAEFQ